MSVRDGVDGELLVSELRKTMAMWTRMTGSTLGDAGMDALRRQVLSDCIDQGQEGHQERRGQPVNMEPEHLGALAWTIGHLQPSERGSATLLAAAVVDPDGFLAAAKLL